ncbi:PorP/SprF family type IX secretion system membrane protein [Parvicella tangerina]|uniref:Type IX secretion system membrane protein PorP/SprF n=1 Tax=Parvicella tangerina TaxID=2829795 RepID=A0A916NEP8_9FLAO|nr:type IX secretion system membrane protein PorP/SprF [Parvicella tangerina]CAG5087205.1 hypothetical protein CRYO30217_03415 [Parvicella tangerina]
MRSLIIFSTITISMLLGIKTVTQQEAMASQYMFNGLFVNPAYAGSHKFFSTTLGFRKQWVAVEGAPQTMVASIDGPLMDNKMGVGLVVANDQIGVSRNTDIVANYAYNIKLGEGKMAFGLKAGFSQYKATVSDLTYWDQEDPIYSSDLVGQTIPRFGFGAYYHVPAKWFAGLSIPTLVAYQKDHKFNLNVHDASFLRRHYYLMGGYIFTIDDKWKIKPSTLIKYVKSAPVQVDINCNVFFKDMIIAGLSYRTGDAMVAIVQYQANQQFRVGYAYDYTLSQLGDYSKGSHEIMVGFDFGKDVPTVRTPRFL